MTIDNSVKDQLSSYQPPSLPGPPQHEQRRLRHSLVLQEHVMNALPELLRDILPVLRDDDLRLDAILDLQHLLRFRTPGPLRLG